MKGQFWGHVHLDMWSVTRECSSQTTCDGAPTGVMIMGPSMTNGWPAKNAAVRLYQADQERQWALLDGITYASDIHAANKDVAKGPQWEKLFSFREDLGLGPNISDWAAWGALADRMAAENSSEWAFYRGRPSKTLYCSGYDISTAPFPPDIPCAADCNGNCKSSWIAYINGTAAKAGDEKEEQGEEETCYAQAQRAHRPLCDSHRGPSKLPRLPPAGEERIFV